LVLACFQNRWRGVGEVMLSAPSPSLVCVCSFRWANPIAVVAVLYRGQEGIAEGLVSGVLKDLNEVS
jgi:hypothetical protein